MTRPSGLLRCSCGQPVELLLEVSGREEMESVCSCGRRLALRTEAAGWSVVAILTPEPSVPISGFSREIRLHPQSRRYLFPHLIGGAEIPVHIVYCASTRIAQVKAADRKVSTYTEVDSPWDARRRWINRFEALRGRSKPGPYRLAESFRRANRGPVAQLGERAAPAALRAASGRSRLVSSD